jgi:hypothetical protein
MGLESRNWTQEELSTKGKRTDASLALLNEAMPPLTTTMRLAANISGYTQDGYPIYDNGLVCSGGGACQDAYSYTHGSGGGGGMTRYPGDPPIG